MSTKYQAAKKKLLETEAINHSELEVLDPTQIYHWLGSNGYRWDDYSHEWVRENKLQDADYFY